MESKMSLDEWVTSEVAGLITFRAVYLEKQKESPSEFPVELEDMGWLEQYDIWRDCK